MKLIVLMEDTCGSPQCEYEHGLSIYIDTGRHKILMDTGASEKTILNAQKLGVDLSQIDIMVLSHGHYDHSGGLPAFRELNQKAVIYMQQSALFDYYHHGRYIGVDQRIRELPNKKILDGGIIIDEEISIFAEISGRRFWPQSNIGLCRRIEGKDIQDEFIHEQCLVIQGEKNLLLSGCAHNGILNILDRYEELYGVLPDVAVSGFHMMKKEDYTDQEVESIRQTARELQKMNTIFYTGHCTGQKAIELMRPIMKDRMIQIHCGMEIYF